MFIEVFKEVHTVKLSTLLPGDIFSSEAGNFFLVLETEDTNLELRKVIYLLNQETGQTYAQILTLSAAHDVTPWPKSKLEIK